MNTVPAGAAEVEPHVLVAEGEPRQLRGGVADVIHLPVRRKHHIQQVEQHILVPLVPEDGLEPRIGEDVDITPGGGAEASLPSGLSSVLIVPISLAFSAKVPLHPASDNTLPPGFSVLRYDFYVQLCFFCF